MKYLERHLSFTLRFDLNIFYKLSQALKIIKSNLKNSS